MKKDIKIDKKNWKVNYENPLLSGIELRDMKDNLVHFVAIKDDGEPHRIMMHVNPNGEPIFPRQQTFEEKIQEKRRQASRSTLSTTTNTRRSSSRRRHDGRSMPLEQDSSEAGAEFQHYDEHGQPINGDEIPEEAWNWPSNHNDTHNVTRAPPPDHVDASSSLNWTPRPSTSRPNPSRGSKSSRRRSTKSNNRSRARPRSQARPAASKQLVNGKPKLDLKAVRAILKPLAPGTIVTLPDGRVIKKSNRPRKSDAKTDAPPRQQPLPPETQELSNRLAQALPPDAREPVLELIHRLGIPQLPPPQLPAPNDAHQSNLKSVDESAEQQHDNNNDDDDNYATTSSNEAKTSCSEQQQPSTSKSQSIANARYVVCVPLSNQNSASAPPSISMNQSQNEEDSSRVVLPSVKKFQKSRRLSETLATQMDEKEIRQLIKAAEPGTLIRLPDGTVIKKSRRGGARAGAGRKRTKNPHQHQPQQQTSQQQQPAHDSDG